MTTQGRPKLREIGHEDRFASRGKFRAITMFDSCYYQIGADTDTAEEAVSLCREFAISRSDLFQVYDDNGKTYF